MNFIKKHKVLIIIITIAVVLLVAAILLFNLFYVNSSKSTYGNRLDGLEEMKPSSEALNKVKTALTNSEAVKDAKIYENGLIINVIIDVNNGVDRDTAKNLTSLITPEFSEPELKYFDIQVFITCESEEAEEKLYPIIGYRHKTRSEFIWTNN